MDGKQFSIQLKCLRIVGFDRENSVKFPKLLRLAQIIAISCLIACLPGEMYFVERNFKDVLAVAEACGPFFVSLTSAVKFITFFMNQEQFYQLIDRIRELIVESNIEDSLIIRKVNQFDRKLTLLYLVSAILTGFGFSFLPIIRNIINVSLLGKYDFLEPLLKYDFPFETDFSPIYEIIYFFYCCAVFVAVFISVRKKS